MFVDGGPQTDECSGAFDRVTPECPSGSRIQIVDPEDFHKTGRGDFLTGSLRLFLDQAGEVRQEPGGEKNAVIPFKNMRQSAFSRLAVDPDNFVVTAPEVCRVHRKVGDGPKPSLFPVKGHAFPDRVLVATRKSCVNQLSEPGMSRGNGQTGAFRINVGDLPGKGQVQSGIHAT